MIKFSAKIHKNKIYITPRPKKDIPGGLVIMFNKPSLKGIEPMATCEIEANQKEYDLPVLPAGFFIIGAFVREPKETNRQGAINLFDIDGTENKN
jgi:hypothetical protein